MARVYRSADLINSAKRKAMIPETQVTFEEKDFLAFANEEMDMAIIPFVLSFHEDYYQNTIILPLVGGQRSYPIPYRSIGNKLRDIQYVDVSGNIQNMNRIFVEDLPKFQSNFQSNQQNYYYIENDEIILVNSPNFGETGSIKVIFYLRPNQLVSEKRVSFISSVNYSTGDIVLSSLPTENVFAAGGLIDFVSVKSPNKILLYDIPIVSINNSTKTITVDPTKINSSIKVGVQVSVAEETTYTQIPTELQSLLSQRVAARCLEALGDAAGLAAANAKIQEIEQKAATLIDARVEGSPMKIVPGAGSLRSIGSYRRNDGRRS